MRVQILHPPAHWNPKAVNAVRPSPPLGLAYIAGTLRAEGYEVSILDAAVEAHAQVHREGPLMRSGMTDEQIIGRLDPEADVLAVGLLFSSGWPFLRGTLRAIRAARPDLVIVCGGEHFTAVPEYSMLQAPIDYVVMGEGEEVITNLLAEMQKPHPDYASVNGICWRNGAAIVRNERATRILSVDEIPHPAWDLFDLDRYNANEMGGVAPADRYSMPLLATRGCPYQCTFCSSPNTWTPRWNARDPISVVDEIEGYINQFGANHFPFQDLTMMLRRSWLLTFCNEILDRGLEFEWSLPTGTRGEVIDREVTDLLYQTGCKSLCLAPETGDQELRDAIKKKMKTDKVKSAVSLTTSTDIQVMIFLVIGFPQETPDTLRATVRMVRELGRLGAQDVLTSFFFPIPATELFRLLEEKGRLGLDDHAFLAPQQMHTAWQSSEYNFTDQISTRRLNFSKYWIAANFYAYQWAYHPGRFLRLLQDVFTGTSHTRLAEVVRHQRKLRKKRKETGQTFDSIPVLPWSPEPPPVGFSGGSGLGVIPIATTTVQPVTLRSKASVG